MKNLRRLPGLFGLSLALATASTVLAAPAMDPNIFVTLAKKTVPSVVNISTLSKIQSPYSRGSQEDLFRKFFEDLFRNPGRGGGEEGEGASPDPRAMSLGTGFIIDKSGLILTNNHVVAGADEIKIHFTEDEDEKPTDGKVVGRDPELDLALIKVETKRELVPMPLGDSDALEVGEYVMAVGNPFGQGHSVTHGIISAKGRKSPGFQLANYIQTDAPINPGNSGGPLVNLKGEVIGINNAIDQRAQGIGFAIPINAVKAVLAQLRSKGSVSRGYIGVLVNELTPEIARKISAPEDLRACFVTHVYPGEPAAKAGIQPYDVILEIAGKKIKSSSDLIATIVGLPVKEPAPTKILRSGKETIVNVVVGLRPGRGGEEADAPRSKKNDSARERTGADLEDLTPDLARDLGVPEATRGAVVMELKYASPADKAGLMRGDLIVEVDRKPIKSADAFYSMVRQKKSYLVRVRRSDPEGGETFQVLVLDMK